MNVMNSTPQSSRQRFNQYRENLGQRTEAPSSSMHSTSSTFDRRRSFASLFWQLLLSLKGNRFRLSLALVGSTFASVLALAPLYGTKIIFDNALGGQPLQGFLSLVLPADNPRELLLWVILSMLGLGLLALAIRTLSLWQVIRVCFRMQLRQRRELFSHVLQLPLNRVYQLKSGGVASMMRLDAGAAGYLTEIMLYGPWEAIVQLVICLLVLSLTDWRLLIGALALLPMIYVTHKTWISQTRPMYRDIHETRQDLDAHTVETFSGIRNVLSFNRERTEIWRFTRNNHVMARQQLRAWWRTQLIIIAWAVLIPAASAAVLVYGGWRVLEDAADIRRGLLTPSEAFTSGDLVLFLAYLGWLLKPLATLTSKAALVQENLAGFDRTLDLYKEQKQYAPRSNRKGLTPSRVAGGYRLLNVSFRYPGASRFALRNLNLEVRPGETVAFVGPSGAGKTTLSNLIAGFLEPTEGIIELDGTDISEFEIEPYRRLIAMVDQDCFLFSDTVIANIAYGRHHATRAQCIAAAVQAGADAFIRDLPDGYDTRVGERGAYLSGGQRQRIAIARSLIASSKILILDEAMSNLDSVHERHIQSILNQLPNMTTFVITHRLNTITNADQIVVFDKGQIVEYGQHQELLKFDGLYRQMFQLQTLELQQ